MIHPFLLKKIWFFRHNADPAMYQAFIGLNLVGNSIHVKEIVVALAGLVACTVSVFEPLVEKESHDRRRQKKYSSVLAKFFCMDTNEIIHFSG